jgi:hypothetical protein
MRKLLNTNQRDEINVLRRTEMMCSEISANDKGLKLVLVIIYCRIVVPRQKCCKPHGLSKSNKRTERVTDCNAVKLFLGRLDPEMRLRRSTLQAGSSCIRFTGLACIRLCQTGVGTVLRAMMNLARMTASICHNLRNLESSFSRAWDDASCVQRFYEKHQRILINFKLTITVKSSLERGLVTLVSCCASTRLLTSRQLPKARMQLVALGRCVDSFINPESSINFFAVILLAPG